MNSELEIGKQPPLEKKSYTAKIAEKIINALEDGTAPWLKPWNGGELLAMRPTNPITNKAYKGINFINLAMEQVALGSNDPRWLTYKQAASMGAQVRQGEKGTTIQYWKFQEELEKVDEKGNPKIGEDGKPEKEIVQLENPKVFFSTVFNASQIDGMPQLIKNLDLTKAFEPIAAAERIISNSGAIIHNVEGAGAYYRPSRDDITLPMKYQFKNEMGYYSTALHELGHWTGHTTRLDRDLSDSFGTQGYAKEELRAEIGSYMLCSELGVDFDPTNHNAYIQSWVSILNDKPNEIFMAAADAGKISQFLQGFNMEHEQSNSVNEEHQKSEAIELSHFDEIDLATKVDHSKYNTLKIPFESVEDAINRFGTMRLDEKESQIIYAELAIDDKKYILSVNGQHSVITPREKWNDTLFDDIQSKHSTVTILTHENTRFDEKNLVSYFQNDPDRDLIIPKSAVEDAINRFGTMEIKDNIGKLVEIKIDNKLYELSVDHGQDGHINPKDYMDQTPFEKNAWKGSTVTVLTPQAVKPPKNVFEEKTFLSVNYSEKEIAKHFGAKWDKDAKLWYAPEGIDRDQLTQFIPVNKETKALAESMVSIDQKDVLAQFKQALEDRGLIINGDPIMDSGKIIRVQVEGDKHGEHSGAYIGYSDGRPAGVIQNFKAGTKDKWIAQGEWKSYTPEQEQAQRAKMEQNRIDRAKERQEEQETVSIKVTNAWKISKEAISHPYLTEKGVEAHGLKLDTRGNLLMPLQDVSGKIWTAQHIGMNGFKGFEEGGKKEGNFFIIGAESVSDITTVVLCEGFATGATIHEAINAPVIVAVDAGNLINVAKAIKEGFPEKEILIAADNDIQKEEAGKDNVGRLKAEAAAAAVKGVLVVPRLTPDEVKKGATDFNDLSKSRGLNEVKKQLDIALDQIKSQEKVNNQNLSKDQSQTMQRELRRQVVRQSSLSM